MLNQVNAENIPLKPEALPLQPNSHALDSPTVAQNTSSSSATTLPTVAPRKTPPPPVPVTETMIVGVVDKTILPVSQSQSTSGNVGFYIIITEYQFFKSTQAHPP